MLPSVQHSQNRSSDQNDQDPQGRKDRHESTSTSNADSKAHGHSTTTRVSYLQAAQGGSTRPMTSAGTTARRGTMPSLQTNGPPGLTSATSSTSTNQSTTSGQPNSGTGSPMERQSMRNGSAANPSHGQSDTSPARYQSNRNGPTVYPIPRQPDNSPKRYQRNGSVANAIRRQLDTTYSPTENSLVKFDAAHGPRVVSPL